MQQLAQWLVRHLNDPELIIWLAQQGGQLHDNLSRLAEEKLDYLARLEDEGKTIELDEIRAHAPNAIPEPSKRALWRLLLTGRVRSLWNVPDLNRWLKRLQRDGLTATLRLELRELLSPRVKLRRRLFPWRGEDKDAEEQSYVDSELVLASGHARSSLRSLVHKNEHWQAALPTFLHDFQQLLQDALDLLRELGKADDSDDRSHWNLPSISPHWQNRGFSDWATLIELLRDAWLAVRGHDPPRATRIARDWFDLPYPTFKRLALFAAHHDDCIAPEQWVEWVTADDAWWLWSPVTKREMMRLLVLQGRHLTPQTQNRLEAAILNGPPRKMYRDDLTVGRWEEIVERSVWLCLSKLRLSGASLGAVAEKRLAHLSTAHPEWQLAADERDEFSSWMIGTGDPGYEKSLHNNIDVG